MFPSSSSSNNNQGPRSSSAYNPNTTLTPSNSCHNVNNDTPNANGPPARQPFVPYYLRTDLPPNRTSKKRNTNQRRRRVTVDELINAGVQQAASHIYQNTVGQLPEISTTGPSPVSSPMTVSTPSPTAEHGPASSSNSSQKKLSVNNGPSSTFDLSSSVKRQEQILNIIKQIQMQQHQQQQMYQQQHQHHLSQPLQNVSVSNIKHKLLYGPHQSAIIPHGPPVYTLTPTVNQMIRQWERKIDEKRQEELEQQFINHYYRQRFGTNNRYLQPRIMLPSLKLGSLQQSSMDDGEISPTSSTTSASSTSTLEDLNEFYDYSSHGGNQLPSLKSLNLPPLNLPNQSSSNQPGGYFYQPTSDEFRFAPSSAPTPRGGSISPISSPRIRTAGRAPQVRHSPRHTPYAIPTNRSPRYSPSQSPRSMHSPRSLTSGSISNRSATSANVGNLSNRADVSDISMMNSPSSSVVPSLSELTSQSPRIKSSNSPPLQQQQPPVNQSQQPNQQQQQLFETVFRHTPIPMAIITVDGKFVSVNNAFVHMLGYSSEEQFKGKETSLFTLQLFGEKHFLQQLIQAAKSCKQSSSMSRLARENDAATVDEQPAFNQNFLHKNGKIVKTANSVGVIEHVFGEGHLILHTVTQYSYL